MYKEIHCKLGIPKDYTDKFSLPQHDETVNLVFAGIDYLGRDLYLESATAKFWQKLNISAADDNVSLFIVSGFRSVEYQTALIQQKINNGHLINEILQVNAAPGYSEHHSGRALDISTEDCEPLSESFENTDAYKWLSENAGLFGFKLSYPRGNLYGISYEPWHWCYNHT